MARKKKVKIHSIIFYRGFKSKNDVKRWLKKNDYSCDKITKVDKSYRVILRPKRRFKILLMPKYNCKDGVKFIKGYLK